MALALYRTYRPGTLADVVGQEHVTEALGRALDADRTHHAYLFSGPRGCGKTSTARILARSLNCERGPTSTPCGTCRSCVDLAPNGPGSIDVIELDAATHRGIDDARDLREKAIYAPAASRFRVYIIDEAHQLTNEAANALLKLIEEPPAHLRFIFATTEPDKIIATIRSRTFHYPFRLVPANVLTEHLARVCQAEGVPAEPAGLAVVAHVGAGSVRDSLSVLGQLLAGAGPQGLTHADAAAALGLTDDALIDGFVEALSGGSVAAMLQVVEAVISAGHDPRRFVADVLDRLRDLIVMRADPGALDSGLIDLPDEAGQRLLAQSETLGLAELSHAADLVSAGLSEVRGATAPRLQLELLCARLALHHPVDDLTSVLARLDRLERSLAAGAPVAANQVAADRAPAGPTAAGPADPSAGPEPESDPTPASTGDGSGVGADDGAVAGGAPVHPSGRPGGPAEPPAASLGKAGTRAFVPPQRPTLRSDRRQPGAAGAASGAAAPPTSLAPNSLDPTDIAQGRSSSAPTTSPSMPAAAMTAAARSAPPAGLTSGSPAAPTQSAPQLARVAAAWPSVLDRVAQGSRVAWTIFAEARPLSVSDGTLAIAVPDSGKIAAITQRGHDVRLREALLAVLQLDLSIDVVHDAGAPADPAAGLATTSDRGSAGVSRPGGSGTSGGAAGSSGHRPRPDAARSAPAGRSSGSGPPGASSAAESSDTQSDAARSSEAPAATPSRWARQVEVAPVDDEPDVPSDDDPDVDELDGLALVTRELGARTISEIDHT